MSLSRELCFLVENVENSVLNIQNLSYNSTALAPILIGSLKGLREWFHVI